MIVDFVPGSCYSVVVDETDLDAFSHTWPCCKLVGLLGVTFTFDREGNLIDIEYRNGCSDDWDGSELLAPSEDAQEFAQSNPWHELHGFPAR